MIQFIIVVSATLASQIISWITPASPTTDSLMYQMLFIIFALMWQNKSYEVRKLK